MVEWVYLVFLGWSQIFVFVIARREISGLEKLMVMLCSDIQMETKEKASSEKISLMDRLVTVLNYGHCHCVKSHLNNMDLTSIIKFVKTLKIKNSEGYNTMQTIDFIMIVTTNTVQILN